MFIVFLSLIWSSVLTHILIRTLGLCRFSGRIRFLFCVALFVAGLGYIPARSWLHYDADSDAAAMLVYFFAILFGYMALLWALLVPIEVMAALVRLLKHIRLWSLPGQEGRYIAAAWWGVAALLVVAGFIAAQAPPRVTHMEVSVPRADARRLVAISDTHLGANASPGLWQKTLEIAREQRPDVLLIVGDLVDDRGRQTERLVARIREFFPHEPVYVVSGNHERYTGYDYFASLCARYGLTWLRQEAVPLGPGLMLGGIDDAREETAVSAVAGVRSRVQGPLLMLTHRPGVAHLFEDRPQTLILSGHTHAGQLPPMTFLVALGNGGFRTGYYRVGEAHLYVSAGAGIWGPPIRLLAPSEIIVLDIKPGSRFEFRSSTLP